MRFFNEKKLEYVFKLSEGAVIGEEMEVMRKSRDN